MSQIQVASDSPSTYRTPRWVKVAGVIALVLILLVGLMLLTGRKHGPGLHTMASSGENTPASGMTPDHMQHGAQHP